MRRLPHCVPLQDRHLIAQGVQRMVVAFLRPVPSALGLPSVQTEFSDKVEALPMDLQQGIAFCVKLQPFHNEADSLQ